MVNHQKNLRIFFKETEFAKLYYVLCRYNYELCRHSQGINLNKLSYMFFQNVYGVIIGGVLGHSLCTGVAVLGGRMIAQRISVRTGK